MKNIGGVVFVLSLFYFMGQWKMEFLPAFVVALILGIVTNLLLNHRR